MTSVVMFVLNDVTKDARVLKEAGSLAAAGYEVTVMGLLPANSLLPEREVRTEGFTIIRTPYPVGREWWRPHPQFFGIVARRLTSSIVRSRYRLTRRRKLLAGSIRRLRYRAARRRKLTVSAIRRLRYRATRRRKLTIAAVRRLRYQAVRRRKLTMASIRRIRYLAARRRRLLIAAARRPRGGREPSRLALTFAFLGIGSPLVWGIRRPAASRPRARHTRAAARRRALLARRRLSRRPATGRHDHRSSRRASRSSARSGPAGLARRARRAPTVLWVRALKAAHARGVAPRSPAWRVLKLRPWPWRLTARARGGAGSAASRAAARSLPPIRSLRPRRSASARAVALIRRLVLPLGRALFFLWSCAYAGVNVLTTGHLDWLLRLRYRWDGWGCAAAARAPLADVWHAHDLSGLFGAMRGRERNGAPVVYDSHEIMLESSGFALRPRWMRWFLARIERRWAAQTTALVTVNNMLARELGQRLGPRRTVVVYNCPPAQEPSLDAGGDLLRSAAGIPAGTPVALYHGGLMLHRGCEQLAEALLEPGLEDVHGVLLGYGGQRDTFVEMAKDPIFGGRLHVLDAVPPDQLVRWVSTADVAVMPIQASTLNHRMSTPNKLFEAIGAGVPVVGSDFEGFRDVVYDNPSGRLGLLCDPQDVHAIARGIGEILALPPAERLEIKRRCIEAARERWNWEREVRGLVLLYDELTSRQAEAGRERKAPAAA